RTERQGASSPGGCAELLSTNSAASKTSTDSCASPAPGAQANASIAAITSAPAAAAPSLIAGASGNEAEAVRLEHGLGLGMHRELAVDALEKAVHGADRQPQHLRRLGIREASRDRIQDLAFARRERRVFLPLPFRDGFALRDTQALQHLPRDHR